MSVRRDPLPAARKVLALVASVSVLAAVAAPWTSPATAAPVPVTTVHQPPSGGHSIIVFPQRDFVSASGFAAGGLVTVDLVHPDGTVFTAGSGLAPQDDPRTPDVFDGLVEVNHPGGYCWQGTTPDIRPGDVVRISDDGTGVADQTTVAAVTAQRPVQTAVGTVVVHGTAAQADGSRIPVTLLEQRLVANRQAFELNGTRTLRASSVPILKGGGTLDYDGPTGGAWTATYAGLSAADVTMALGAESRALWLGNAVAPSIESTIYELGAGIRPGPALPGCTAPLERVVPPPGSDVTPPSVPTLTPTATSNFSDISLGWSASVDTLADGSTTGVTSYGVYRDGVAIDNVQNAAGTPPAPQTYVDRNVPPGTYAYTVDAADAAGNRSAPSAGEPGTATARPVAAKVANEPPSLPVQLISFPSRDFVSPSGFAPTDVVDIELVRAGRVISTSSARIPQDDERTPGFDGLVEVNHPGGGCWEGSTPEIRPGDVIRTTAYAPDIAGVLVVRTVDQTRTADVTATGVVVATPASTATSTDGTVQVHGTAVGADGKPLPLAQIQSRLVANRDAFDLTARRTLRAGGVGSNGTLVYDVAANPTGVRWTATYAGLTSDDVFRAAGGTSLTGRVFTGAESRVLWLGVNPLSGQEITIFEVGTGTSGGPAPAFCSTPLEAPDIAPPTAPTALQVTQSGPSAARLDWTASTDDWYVAGYRISQDGRTVAQLGGTLLAPGDSTSTFTVPTSFTLSGVAPGPHSYAVEAYDNASPRGAGATPIAQLAAGLGQPYGNTSTPSTTVLQTQADVTAPSVPAGLVARAGVGTVNLSWAAATDDVGVVGYRVYRDAVKIADVPSGTSFLDNGLVKGSYSYSVDAVDAAGNASAQSAAATAIVTETPDTMPPSVPADVVASTSPDIHGRDVRVTWTASTDNVGVTAYQLFRDGAATPVANIVAGTSYLDTGRPAGTYTYTVTAADSAGNVSAASLPARAAVANDPPLRPHALIAFPGRDFLSATGYAAADGPYTFSVVRGAVTVSTSEPVAARDDPLTVGFDGIVEVNHPGGGCWTVNTPDLRAGDVVRITNAAGLVEQTTSAKVTAERPIAVDATTVVVHGTADNGAGAPIPVAQLDQRLIANRDPFDANQRRTLRAGTAADGVLTYDTATATSWTATYSGLSANDVARAVGGTSPTGQVFVGAESRALWLGRDPLALTESTVYENGPSAAPVTGGPAAPCTAPLEPGSPLASISPNSVAFGGQSALPASTSPVRTVTVSNGGPVPVRLGRPYLAGLHSADYALGSTTCTVSLSPGLSCTIGVTFSPKALGDRSASVNVETSAANRGNLTVELTGTGTDTAAPSSPGAPAQSISTPGKLNVLTGASLPASTVPVALAWTGSTGTVTSYHLQQSTGGGVFTDLALQPGTTRSSTLALPMGTSAAPRSYQYRVRACNGVNCSAWVVGPAFTVVPVDEGNSSAFSYGGTWTTSTLSGAYGGAVRYAVTSKDKLTLSRTTFTVSGNVAWVSTLGADRGRATVQVDGGIPVAVDLYAASLQPASVVWSTGFAAGSQHSVTIQVTGTKNAASTGTRVDLDAFVLVK